MGDENVRLWQHSIDTGQDFELEHRFRRWDGEYRWHLSRGCRELAENIQEVFWVSDATYGGRIWAESCVGEGTTFYFTIPAADSPASPEER